MKQNIISVAVVTALIASFNGCGSSSSDSSSNAGTISTDISEYFEKNSQSRNMLNLYQDSRQEKEEKIYYKEDVVVKNNSITYSVNSAINAVITIGTEDLNITIPRRNNHSYLIKRNPKEGEVISSYTVSSTKVENEVTMESKKREECIFDAKLTTLTLKSKTTTLTYEGDILRQKCTLFTTNTYTGKRNEVRNSLDIAYSYYQKDKGQIAGENKDCWVKHENSSPDNNETYYLINDKSNTCEIRTNTQTLLLE